MKINSKRTALIIFIVFIFLFFFVGYSMVKIFFGVVAPGEESSGKGNVALIAVKGVITVDGDMSMFAKGAVSSSEIIREIERAKKDKAVKAVILEINSGGGSPVASDEISAAVKELKEETNKTVVAWIREIGASGGYWIASSADYIIANKMSLTGSIGVISSYLDFSSMLQNYNVSYERLISGEHKDMGTPWRELSEEERGMFQSQLDKIREYFIREVAGNRRLEESKVRELATGEAFLGADAMEKGLIDELGAKKEVINYIEKRLGITADIIEYQKPISLLKLLTSAMEKDSYLIGKGIGSALVEAEEPLMQT